MKLVEGKINIVLSVIHNNLDINADSHKTSKTRAKEKTDVLRSHFIITTGSIL